MKAILAWVARHRFTVLLALTYAYFFQGSDPNQSTRFFMTKALVERGTLDITPDHARTVDQAEHDGHYYADKAPVVSLVATVPYAALRAVERVAGLDPDAEAVRRARFHTLVAIVSGLSGVLAAAMVRRTLRLLGTPTREATLVAFAYALGTLAFPYSTLLFGHETAAAILAATFAIAVGDRARTEGEPSRPLRLGLGALWALAITTEYPSALLVAALGLYFLAGARSVPEAARSLGWVALGAIPIFAVHAWIMWREFGSPFDLAYRHEVDPMFRGHMSTGVLGIGKPRLGVLVAALVSPYRGLLFYCPVLVLTFAGFGAWMLSGERPAEAIACAAVCALSLLLTSGYYAWDGDFATGPRHMVSALPFFAMPIAWWTRRGAWARRVTIAAIVPSVLVMLACTAVVIQTPKGDPWRADPLYSIVIPALARHTVALNPVDPYHFSLRHDASYNLGTLFGLGAWTSLAIPVLAWALAYARLLVPRRAA